MSAGWGSGGIPAALIFLIGLASSDPSVAQVPLVLDTDFGGDADDIGALVMLHGLMAEGECEILAIMSWNTERYAVPGIEAVNRDYGHPDIPIGTRKDAAWHEQWQYGKAIAESFQNTLMPEVGCPWRGRPVLAPGQGRSGAGGR